MSDSLQRSDERPSWHDTWLSVAQTIAKRSLCSRAQVGAVIVNSHNRPISMGYNGPPRGFDHMHDLCTSWCARSSSIPAVKDRKYKDCPSLHAEQNALITADKANFTKGTIYVSSHICETCAKLIANSGLSTVMVHGDAITRTYRNYHQSYDFLKSLGIQVYVRS